MIRITTQPASEMKLLLDGKNGQKSRMVSLQEYYKQTYNVQITKPRLVSLVSIRLPQSLIKVALRQLWEKGLCPVSTASGIRHMKIVLRYAGWNLWF